MFIAVLFTVVKTGSNQDAHQEGMDKQTCTFTQWTIIIQWNKWTIKPQKDMKDLNVYW